MEVVYSAEVSGLKDSRPASQRPAVNKAQTAHVPSLTPHLCFKCVINSLEKDVLAYTDQPWENSDYQADQPLPLQRLGAIKDGPFFPGGLQIPSLASC